MTATAADPELSWRVSAAASPPRVLILIDRLGYGGAEVLAASLASGLRARGVDARLAHLSVEDGNPLAAEARAAGVLGLDLHLRSLFDPRPLIGWRSTCAASASTWCIPTCATPTSSGGPRRR